MQALSRSVFAPETLHLEDVEGLLAYEFPDMLDAFAERAPKAGFKMAAGSQDVLVAWSCGFDLRPPKKEAGKKAAGKKAALKKTGKEDSNRKKPLVNVNPFAVLLGDAKDKKKDPEEADSAASSDSEASATQAPAATTQSEPCLQVRARLFLTFSCAIDSDARAAPRPLEELKLLSDPYTFSQAERTTFLRFLQGELRGGALERLRVACRDYELTREQLGQIYDLRRVRALKGVQVCHFCLGCVPTQLSMVR
jgi:hypothetical protein